MKKTHLNEKAPNWVPAFLLTCLMFVCCSIAATAQKEVNCNTIFSFSDTPTAVPGNTKEVRGTINGIGYKYSSDQPIRLADFSQPESTLDPTLRGTKKGIQTFAYPKTTNLRDGSAVFSDKEVTILSTAVQIRNTVITKNTITFDEPIDNPVLYFTSIGKKGLRVPISFDREVALLGEQGTVEISEDAKTITGEEGVAVVGIQGKVKELTFEYKVAENACFFFFGASFTNCETGCDKPHYIKDVVKFTKEIERPPSEGVVKFVQGEKMVSENGEFQMRITSDGRLVIEKILGTTECNGQIVVTETREVWTPPTTKVGSWDKNKSFFRFGGDCNLCYESVQKYEHWCATYGGGDATSHILSRCKKMVLTNDGRLVLIGQDDSEKWSSTAKPSVPDITKTNGEWSYGYGPRGDSFTAFEEKKIEGVVTRNHKSGYTWWSVAQNTSAKSHTDTHSITYPPTSDGAFIFHPGSAPNQNAKARFTASADGTYTFNILWKLVDEQGEKVSAEVYTNAGSVPKISGKNYAELVKQVLSNTSPQKAMFKEIEVDLKKGEWVSIEVENGENGHSDDSTLVEMSAIKSK